MGWARQLAAAAAGGGDLALEEAVKLQEQAAGKFSHVFNGEIDVHCVGEMMCYTLIFTMTFEYMCDRVELLVKDNKAHYAIFNKLIRELMIMGFVGFALIIVTEVRSLSDKHVACFEFTDLLTFFVALAYIVSCMVIVFMMTRARRTWDKIQATSVDDLCADLDTICAPEEKRWFKSPEYKIVIEAARWKVMQLAFVREFHFEGNFDYLMYVKLVLEDNVTTFIQITSATWLYVLVVALAITIRTGGKDYLTYHLETTFSNSTLDAVDSFRRLGAKSSHAAPVQNYSTLGSLGACEAGWNLTNHQCCVEAGYNSSRLLCNLTAACTSEVHINAHHNVYGEVGKAHMAGVMSGIGLSWGLLVCNTLISWYIQRKTNKFFHLEECHSISDITQRLHKLNQSPGKPKRSMLDSEDFAQDELHSYVDSLNGGTEIDVELSSENDHADIVDAGKGLPEMELSTQSHHASRIISPYTLRKIMGLIQAIALVDNFYMAMHVVHIKKKISDVVVGWEPMQGSNDRTMLFIEFVVHIAAMVPYLIMAFSQTPSIITRMAMLNGTLYLDTECASQVQLHTEQVYMLRERVRKKLERVTLHYKGKNGLTAAHRKNMYNELVEAKDDFTKVDELWHRCDMSQGTGAGDTIIKATTLLEAVDDPTQMDLIRRIVEEAESMTPETGTVDLRHLHLVNTMNLGYAIVNAKQAQVEGRLINDAHEYAEKRIGISAKEVFHMVQLAHARMLFKRADIDDDGFLTEREFRYMLKLCHFNLGAEDFSNLYRVVSVKDRDKDADTATVMDTRIITESSWETFMSCDEAEFMDSMARLQQEELQARAKEQEGNIGFSMLKDLTAGVTDLTTSIVKDAIHTVATLESSVEALERSVEHSMHRGDGSSSPRRSMSGMVGVEDDVDEEDPGRDDSPRRPGGKGKRKGKNLFEVGSSDMMSLDEGLTTDNPITSGDATKKPTSIAVDMDEL